MGRTYSARSTSISGSPVRLAELAALARRHDLPLVVDLGSGAIEPLAATTVRPPDGSPPRREPTVREVLRHPVREVRLVEIDERVVQHDIGLSEKPCGADR
mgnify:CR=1 FL=1